jgi:hypothetical protein
MDALSKTMRLECNTGCATLSTASLNMVISPVLEDIGSVFGRHYQVKFAHVYPYSTLKCPCAGFGVDSIILLDQASGFYSH